MGRRLFPFCIFIRCLARGYTYGMPPSLANTPTELPAPTPTDHLLASHVKRSKSVGPTVGIIIVVVLMLLGALYFWGARLNREQAPVPYIPGDSAALAQ